MKQQRALRLLILMRLKIYRMLVRAGSSVGKLQSWLSIRRRRSPISPDTPIIVGRQPGARCDAPNCRANFPMMRGFVLVAECCTEADCASIRQQSETTA